MLRYLYRNLLLSPEAQKLQKDLLMRWEMSIPWCFMGNVRELGRMPSLIPSTQVNITLKGEIFWCDGHIRSFVGFHETPPRELSELFELIGEIDTAMRARIEMVQDETELPSINRLLAYQARLLEQDFRPRLEAIQEKFLADQRAPSADRPGGPSGHTRTPA